MSFLSQKIWSTPEHDILYNFYHVASSFDTPANICNICVKIQQQIVGRIVSCMLINVENCRIMSNVVELCLKMLQSSPIFKFLQTCCSSLIVLTPVTNRHGFCRPTLCPLAKIWFLTTIKVSMYRLNPKVSEEIIFEC